MKVLLPSFTTHLRRILLHALGVRHLGGGWHNPLAIVGKELLLMYIFVGGEKGRGVRQRTEWQHE
jgi:hypothetical protein